MTLKRFLLLSALLTGLMAGFPHPLPASSVIANMLSASRALVKVTGRAGGIAPAPTQSYLDPATGRILNRKPIKAFQYEKSGGGVIIDKSGIIATNAHTLQGAMQILVTLHDGRQYTAEPIFVAPGQDIVLIRIQTGEDLPSLKFADSDALKFQSTVYSIGSSELLDNTISEGIITGLGQSRSAPGPGDPKIAMLQINFKVYPGDSGSPVLDSEGRLLGMTVAGRTTGRQATLAIPANTIRKALRDYNKGQDQTLA